VRGDGGGGVKYRVKLEFVDYVEVEADDEREARALASQVVWEDEDGAYLAQPTEVTPA